MTQEPPDAAATPASSTTEAMRRVLGRWDLALLFVVAITNLNVVPTVAAGGLASLALWALALVLFFWPQGIAVIELAHLYPGEGGLYLWTQREMGSFHGFLAGWCYWTNNLFYVPTVLLYFVGVVAFAGGQATVGLADDRLTTFAIAAALLWILTWVNIRGLGVGKWVNNIGGIGTGIACLALIGLAVACISGHGLDVSQLTVSPEGGGVRLDWHLVSSFGVVCFALVGLELASIMGDEIREPRKNLPPAILWGGVICGVLYLGTTLAILFAIPAHEVGALQGVMQAVDRLADTAGVRGLVSPLAVVLSISIAGIASVWFSGSARLVFVAGLDHYLPPAMGRLHPRFGTPHVALVVQAVLATGILAMSFVGASVKEAFTTLLDLAVILQLIPYLYVFAILIRRSLARAAPPAVFRKQTLRWAGIFGLATTALGTTLPIVPTRDIKSIWLFELKLFVGLAVFLGLAVLMTRRRRASAPEGSAP